MNSNSGAIAKIVLIDDDKLVCEVVKKMLSVSGKYALSSFTDPKAGLRYIKNTIPDVIILDIHMPEIDGIELLKMIKDDPFVCHVPIAILTGDDHEDMKDTAISSYAEAYIVKPATQEKLEAALSAILKNVHKPEKSL